MQQRAPRETVTEAAYGRRLAGEFDGQGGRLYTHGVSSRSRIRRTQQRSILKVAFAIVVFAMLVVATAVAVIWVLPMPFYEDVPEIEVGVTHGDATQIARGKRIATLACAGCHGNAEVPHLIGRTMTEAPKVWGTVVASNLTHNRSGGIGGMSDGLLARSIRTGVRHDGMFLVPLMPRYSRMADEDLAALIAFLRSEDPMLTGISASPGDPAPSLKVKLQAQFTWRPVAAPDEAIERPADDDLLALGKYLVDDLLQCNICHGSNYESAAMLDPTMDTYYLGGGMAMTDLNGRPIKPGNITPDEVNGIGAWTYQQFRAALTDGRAIDGRQMRWPMRRYWTLEENEVAAIWAYLRTVEPVGKAVDDPPDYRIPGQKLDVGRHVFFKQGCYSCHGDKTPHRMLLDTAKHFDTDEKAALFIAEPTAGNGLGPMPSYADRLNDEELLALGAYVRSMATATRGR